MSFKKGDLIKVKTKTFNDVFGEVIYKCIREDAPLANGGKGCVFEIVSGTGEGARIGFQITDTRESMEKCLASGIAQIVNNASLPAKPQKNQHLYWYYRV